MPWILLIIASLFEIAWAVGLKFTHGFTRFWPTLGTVTALLASVTLLGVAAKPLPIGTAYAVWTGIGAAGTVVFGIVILGDPATGARLFCVGLILAGVIGLKVASPGAAAKSRVNVPQPGRLN
jgi:quaternary ammonium compound-resistance protein SugE